MNVMRCGCTLLLFWNNNKWQRSDSITNGVPVVDVNYKALREGTLLYRTFNCTDSICPNKQLVYIFALSSNLSNKIYV